MGPRQRAGSEESIKEEIGMSNQELEVLREIIVQVPNSIGVFKVPQAIVNQYSIRCFDGIRCVLKEKSDDVKMKNAEKIDKEILIDVDKTDSTTWIIPRTTLALYDIKYGDTLRLLIKERIH